MGVFERVKKVFAPKNELVQSDLRISEVVSYVNSTGDVSLYNLYGVGTGLRDQAVHFAVFFRVVNLLSSMIAQLITSGSLRIVNAEGEIDEGSNTKMLLDLLQNSPDGETPAFSFFEDLAVDYLIDGNSLLSINRAGNKVSSLRRLEGPSSQIDYTSENRIVYKAHDAYATDKTEGDYLTFADMDVIHARWPLLTNINAVGHRSRFASPPVGLMRPALSIGLESDKYILDWYKTDSPKSNVGISIQKGISPKQLEEFYTQFERAAKSRAPLLFGEGARFTNLNNSSSGSSTQAVQREFQVGEICRIYGVPGPLVNQQVTSWGSGIEQLSKLFYRFGLRQHTERLLSPMKMKLLPRGYRFTLNEIDILRGDTAGIAAMLGALKGDAQTPEIATIEERRHIAGLPLKPEYGELQPLPQRYGGGEGEPMEDNNNDPMEEDE